MHEVGFYKRIAKKKPFLSDAQRCKNFEFASEHQKWTSEEWKKVNWIDESTFDVEKILQQIIVWQKSDKQYKLDYLIPTFKLGHTSIIVWKAL